MLRNWRSNGPRRTTARRAPEDLARSLSLILDPEALRASVANRVRELTGSDAVIFCALRGDQDVFGGTYRTPPSSDAHAPSIAANGRLAKWLRVNQEPFLMRNASGALEYLDAPELEDLRRADVRVCAPLLAGSRLIGVLLICADERWGCSDEDRHFLADLCRRSALALENAELHSGERERLRNLYRAEQLAVAGQLAATVAHEIRNPLTAIRSTVQFVADAGCDEETQRRLLRQVIAEVDRIEHTVSGVLALTRTHDGNFAASDLAQIVDDALRLVEAYARAHDITVARDHGTSPLLIHCDRRGLQQVCINIFLNACQAMPDGGQLTVRTQRRITDRGARAVLQVHDTGPGIPPEDLQKVFDPFFTTKPGGTGLGLAICLDVVTRHQGDIRLESEPEGGMTARISLPLEGGG